MPDINSIGDINKRTNEAIAKLKGIGKREAAFSHGTPFLAPFQVLQTLGLYAGATASDIAQGEYGRTGIDWSAEGAAGALGVNPEKRSGITIDNAPAFETPTRFTKYGAVFGARNPYGWEKASREHPTLMAIGQTLGEIGTDPLTFLGLGSGIRAVAKARGASGLIPFNRMLGLNPSGIEGEISAIRAAEKAKGVADDVIENYVQNVLRNRLGKETTFSQAMIGLESPHEFFRKGILFNKTPVAELAGKIDEIVGKAPSTSRIPADILHEDVLPVETVQAVKAAENAKPATIDDLFESAKRQLLPQPEIAQVKPAAKVLDAMPGEQMLDEARAMAGKSGLYGDMADEVAQDAAARTWTSLQGMDVIEGGDAVKKIRATLKGHVRHSMRDAKRHPGGITNIPGEVNPNVARFEDVFGEPVEARFSLREAADRGENAINALEKRILGDKDFSAAKVEGKRLRLTSRAGDEILVGFYDELPVPARAAGYESTAGKVATGRAYVDVKGFGRIDLGKLADAGTWTHEKVHLARRWQKFSGEEWQSLARRYAKGVTDESRIEELIAQGLAKDSDMHAGIIQRIQEFFAKLYELATGTATETGTVRKWREGDIFARASEMPARNALVKAKGTQSRAVEELVKRGPGEFARSSAERFGEIMAQRPVKGYEPVARFSLEESSSALTRAARRGHVQGVFDAIDEKQGTLGRIFSKEGRAGIYNDLMEKAVDELFRAGKAIKKTGGEVTYKFFRTLPGLLSRAKHTIENGISVHGKTLYKGNMVSDITDPIVNFMKKRMGEFTTAQFDEEMTKASVYAVSRRAIGLYNQAMANADALAKTIRNGADKSNPMVFRGMIDANDIEKAAQMGENQARQFLRGKAESWAKRNTGLGADGVTDIDEARSIIREVEADKEMQQAYDAMRGVQQKINKASVEYVYEKGMINKDARDYMLATEDYTPLARVMDETAHARNAGSGAELVKTLKGSQREILNPIISTIDSTVNWMRRADINEVFARWLGGADIESLAEIGVRQVDEGADGLIKAVIIDGKRTFWKFDDKDLFNSVERIGRAEPTDSFTKMMGYYKRIVREAVTHSPGFPIRNFVRDSFMRVITSESGTGLFAGAQKFTDEEMEAFIRSGSDQAGFYGRAGEEYAKAMRNSIAKISGDKKTVLMRADDAKKLIGGVWDKWGDFLAKGEMQNRLAEFRAARQKLAKQYPEMAQWEIDRLAAYEARNLMDFAVIGEWGRKINNFVPFFNPAVQGTAKIISSAASNPRRFMRQLMTYVAMPSIGCYMYNASVGADKEYRNLPAYRRDLYWNFKIGDTWLSIPKPFEAGVLGTFFERSIDYAHSGKKEAFSGVFPSVERGDLGTLVKSVSPIDEALFAGPFRPVLEILANKDMFRDSYIIPPHEEGLDMRLRKGAENASEVSKIFAKITGQAGILKDPRQWDYLMRGLFSEYGRIVTDLTGQNPEKTIAKNASGGFLREPSAWSLQSVQDVMRQAKEKGISRRKEHREFVDSLRGTAANPTQANINRIIDKAEREEKRISRISIDEILRKK